MIVKDNIQISNNQFNYLVGTYSKDKELFIYINMPLIHIEKCGQLSGKCLQVYLHLIWVYTVTKKNPIKPQHKLLKNLGVDRYAFYRAIKKMSSAGLIEFTNKRGSSPLITLNCFELKL